MIPRYNNEKLKELRMAWKEFRKSVGKKVRIPTVKGKKHFASRRKFAIHMRKMNKNAEAIQQAEIERIRRNKKIKGLE